MKLTKALLFQLSFLCFGISAYAGPPSEFTYCLNSNGTIKIFTQKNYDWNQGEYLKGQGEVSIVLDSEYDQATQNETVSSMRYQEGKDVIINESVELKLDAQGMRVSRIKITQKRGGKALHQPYIKNKKIKSIEDTFVCSEIEVGGDPIGF
ncbi:MAG: hypothetical protein KDD34_00955 [Bdellovibrionales bacterium]|nr:hypothetical protein [Bdellovibrionales bacterium]